MDRAGVSVAREYINKMEQYQHEVLMCPDKKEAIELSNTPQNEDIRGCIIAYWTNYVNRKRTRSSSAWLVSQSLRCRRQIVDTSHYITPSTPYNIKC